LAVESYRAWLELGVGHAISRDGPLPPTREEIRTVLGGHDLACWCALYDPCHADVLLELANVQFIGEQFMQSLQVGAAR
jgi:hypothetical protein